MSRIFLTAIFVAFAATSFAAEYHGRISIDDYYSDDSSSAYDYHIFTNSLRLDATKLNDAGTISFHFDGRERNNLGSSDYSSTVKDERIDSLNIEYAPTKRFSLISGRLTPKEMGIEKVDGLNLVIQGNGIGAGIFGGLKPDPYTQEFSSDFTTGGSNFFYRDPSLSADIAYVYNGYKGKADRQYIYGQTSYYMTKELRLYGMITADLESSTNKTQLTNAIAEISYRPDYTKGITIGYNQFRSYTLEESSADYIEETTDGTTEESDTDDTRQQSYYVSGDFRFLKRYTLYGRYERQIQLYDSLITDSMQIGFKNDDLLASGTVVDLSVTITDSYSSRYETCRMEINRLFLEMLQVTLYGSFMQGDYEDIDYEDDIATYGASAYLHLAKRWTISLSYEGREAADYETNSVMSHVSYKF